MDRDDAARIAHYQRWLRPDWRRWLHPDWERFVHPAQREAMRKDFALRDRAFETPLARRWREKQEQREREEQERLEEIAREALSIKAEIAELRFEFALRRKKWEAECADRKLRADIAWERFKAAFMRGDFAPRQKANFNPNQPRVSAGNPDGGQWTDGSGAQSRTGEAHDRATGRNDPRVLSDVTPDSLAKPGAQLAQDDTARRALIDLREEQQLGGHAIEGHVNKSANFLLSRVRDIASAAEKHGDLADGLRVGSFSSLEAANKLVNATVAQNRDLVDKVASGTSPREDLNARFGSPTGYEAYARNERSQPYLRDTYGVSVVIVPDGRVARGYRIDTAFPRNFDR